MKLKHLSQTIRVGEQFCPSCNSTSLAMHGITWRQTCVMVSLPPAVTNLEALPHFLAVNTSYFRTRLAKVKWVITIYHDTFEGTNKIVSKCGEDMVTSCKALAVNMLYYHDAYHRHLSPSHKPKSYLWCTWLTRTSSSSAFHSFPEGMSAHTVYYMRILIIKLFWIVKIRVSGSPKV